MPDDDVAEAVRFEAADRFGLEPDRAEFRYILAGDVRQGTDIRQEVIVLARNAPSSTPTSVCWPAPACDPPPSTPLPAALFRGFERFLRRGGDRNEANVFVDLGYSGTQVAVSRGSDLIFLKSVPIGGRRFDELVAESLSLRTSTRLSRSAGASAVSMWPPRPASPTKTRPPAPSTRTSAAPCWTVRPGARAAQQGNRSLRALLRGHFPRPAPDAVTVVGGKPPTPTSSRCSPTR